MKTKLYWQFKLPHYLLHHLQVWISSDKTKSNIKLNHVQSKHHLFADVLNYSVYFFKWAATHMHPLPDNTPGPSGKWLLFCVTAVSTKQKQPKHTLVFPTSTQTSSRLLLCNLAGGDRSSVLQQTGATVLYSPSPICISKILFAPLFILYFPLAR